MESLIEEEKFLSSLYCNPALERRIRGGLSYSEPRSLYSEMTVFTQRFSIIWKIPVDFTWPCGLSHLPKPACIGMTWELQIHGGWPWNLLISKSVGFGMATEQGASPLATEEVASPQAAIPMYYCSPEAGCKCSNLHGVGVGSNGSFIENWDLKISPGFLLFTLFIVGVYFGIWYTREYILHAANKDADLILELKVIP